MFPILLFIDLEEKLYPKPKMTLPFIFRLPPLLSLQSTKRGVFPQKFSRVPKLWTGTYQCVESKGANFLPMLGVPMAMS